MSTSNALEAPSPLALKSDEKMAAGTLSELETFPKEAQKFISTLVKKLKTQVAQQIKDMSPEEQKATCSLTMAAIRPHLIQQSQNCNTPQRQEALALILRNQLFPALRGLDIPDVSEFQEEEASTGTPDDGKMNGVEISSSYASYPSSGSSHDGSADASKPAVGSPAPGTGVSTSSPSLTDTATLSSTFPQSLSQPHGTADASVSSSTSSAATIPNAHGTSPSSTDTSYTQYSSGYYPNSMHSGSSYGNYGHNSHYMSGSYYSEGSAYYGAGTGPMTPYPPISPWISSSTSSTYSNFPNAKGGNKRKMPATATTATSAGAKKYKKGAPSAAIEPILGMSAPFFRPIGLSTPPFRGSDISVMQHLLVRIGYILRISETFDEATVEALRDFQRKESTVGDGDGVFGAKSSRALIQRAGLNWPAILAHCGNSYNMTNPAAACGIALYSILSPGNLDKPRQFAMRLFDVVKQIAVALKHSRENMTPRDEYRMAKATIVRYIQDLFRRNPYDIRSMNEGDIVYDPVTKSTTVSIEGDDDDEPDGQCFSLSSDGYPCRTFRSKFGIKCGGFSSQNDNYEEIVLIRERIAKEGNESIFSLLRELKEDTETVTELGTSAFIGILVGMTQATVASYSTACSSDDDVSALWYNDPSSSSLTALNVFWRDIIGILPEDIKQVTPYLRDESMKGVWPCVVADLVHCDVSEGLQIIRWNEKEDVFQVVQDYLVKKAERDALEAKLLEEATAREERKKKEAKEERRKMRKEEKEKEEKAKVLEGTEGEKGEGDDGGLTSPKVKKVKKKPEPPPILSSE